jgi:hypothetical protein
VDVDLTDVMVHVDININMVTLEEDTDMVVTDVALMDVVVHVDVVVTKDIKENIENVSVKKRTK